MMNAVTRLLVLCLAGAPLLATANSADTGWLLDSLRAQLKTQAAWRAMENCQSPLSSCMSLHGEPDTLAIFSTTSYPEELTVRYIPSQESPWFLSPSDTRHPQHPGDDYNGTKLMQGLKSLEVLSFVSFWERDGAELFLGINEKGIVGMHLRSTASSRRSGWIGDLKSESHRSSLVPASAFAR